MAIERDKFIHLFGRSLSLSMKVTLLRKDYEFSVTSWWRSEARNKIVGGIDKSKHLTGEAIDVVLDESEDKAKFTEAAKDLGLYVYDEVDHLHLYEVK